MPRLSKKDVHQALEKAAQNILDARGDDPVTSRRDIRLKLNELEGVERRLTSIFYAFMDHRDYKPGARITEKDVKETLEYSKKHLVDNYDLNRNGLSKTEIEKMSLTGKFAVQLARELKRAAAESTIETSEDIFEMLKELGEGLAFMGYATEADIELEAFYKEANLEELTEASLSQALGLDSTSIHEQLARFDDGYFLTERQFTEMYEELDARDGASPKLPQVLELFRFLKAHIKQLSVAIVGLDISSVDSEHPVYWVGLGPDGHLVGFKSAVIWT